MHTTPNSHWEDHYRNLGYKNIVGIDEAGRGALAGPVVAAAVIMPLDKNCLPKNLNDSKLLSPKERAKIFTQMSATGIIFALGLSTHQEIDSNNILKATLTAMQRAAAALPEPADILLIDGNQAITTEIPQKCLIGGDRISMSIAAASVIAKHSRDLLMLKLHQEFPAYGFDIHKGYGTATHRAALQNIGPSPQHRLSFRGVLCA